MNCLNNICEPNRESCERDEWKISTETQITWPRSEEESEAGEEDTKKVVKARGGESKKKSGGGCWLLGVVHIVARKLRTCISCSLNPPRIRIRKHKQAENQLFPRYNLASGTNGSGNETAGTKHDGRGGGG